MPECTRVLLSLQSTHTFQRPAPVMATPIVQRADSITSEKTLRVRIKLCINVHYISTLLCTCINIIDTHTLNKHTRTHTHTHTHKQTHTYTHTHTQHHGTRHTHTRETHRHTSVTYGTQCLMSRNTLTNTTHTHTLCREFAHEHVYTYQVLNRKLG